MWHDSPSLLFTLATEYLTTSALARDEGPGFYLASATWGVGADEAWSGLLPALRSVSSSAWSAAVLRMAPSCYSASAATWARPRM
jgi:hypothetical protein